MGRVYDPAHMQERPKPPHERNDGLGLELFCGQFCGIVARVTPVTDNISEFGDLTKNQEGTRWKKNRC